MPTIKDVAEKAGVSITTVSHVINKTRFVSAELTERVYSAMEEMRYYPNVLAGSLRTGRTKTIGLLVPDISNQFFAEISRKIEDRGFEFGYSLILCNTDDDPIKELSYLNVLMEKQVDGIIFISTGKSETNLRRLIELKIPIVFADREISHYGSDVVLLDNWRGGYDATNYLISLNHKRIACISGPSLVSPSAKRVEGYKQALHDANINFDPDLLQIGDFRFESGEMAMKKLLDNPNQPTAIFVCNDMMSLGAMRAIYDSGKQVPDDYSMIGFDNIALANTLYPALTTMAQPVQKMTELVLDLLLEKIVFKQQQKRNHAIQAEYKNIQLTAELIVRDSCRKI